MVSISVREGLRSSARIIQENHLERRNKKAGWGLREADRLPMSSRLRSSWLLARPLGRRLESFHPMGERHQGGGRGAEQSHVVRDNPRPRRRPAVPEAPAVLRALLMPLHAVAFPRGASLRRFRVREARAFRDTQRAAGGFTFPTIRNVACVARPL